MKPIEPPLADPFPVPQNFHPDVELALKSYLSQVVSVIFGFRKVSD